MQARIIAALLVLGGVATGAEAITVKANVGGVELPACANAANVSFNPAATRAAMRFNYECPSEGIARSCAPAAYAPGTMPGAALTQNLQSGEPAFVYEAMQGGPVITVVCDAGGTPEIPVPVIKGTEIVGSIDGVELTGCHPAINFMHANESAAVAVSREPVASCPATGEHRVGNDANCFRFQCPGDAAVKACFPVAGMQYHARLASTDSALRRVTVHCESSAPMLTDSFGD